MRKRRCPSGKLAGRTPLLEAAPGLRFYQALTEKDRRARLLNQQRLRELRAAHGGEVAICCSHEMREFEAADAAGPRGLEALGGLAA